MGEDLQRYRVQQERDICRLIRQANDEGNAVDWHKISTYVQLNQPTCKFLAERNGLYKAPAKRGRPRKQEPKDDGQQEDVSLDGSPVGTGSDEYGPEAAGAA